jgi:hypothetical protein
MSRLEKSVSHLLDFLENRLDLLPHACGRSLALSNLLVINCTAVLLRMIEPALYLSS